jgi:hypothetical protein
VGLLPIVPRLLSPTEDLSVGLQLACKATRLVDQVWLVGVKLFLDVQLFVEVKLLIDVGDWGRAAPAVFDWLGFFRLVPVRGPTARGTLVDDGDDCLDAAKRSIT